MFKHVAMQQPRAGIVRDKGNLPVFAGLHQQGVAERTVFAVGQNLLKVMPVQVHGVWPPCVVGHPYVQDVTQA